MIRASVSSLRIKQIAFVLALFGFLSMFSGLASANADISNMPSMLPEPQYLLSQYPDPGGSYGDDNQYINLTRGSDDEPSGKGANTPVSWFKIYSTTASGKTLRLGAVDRNAGPAASKGFFIAYSSLKIDSEEIVRGLNSRDRQFIDTVAGDRNPDYPGGWNLNIPASAFVRSTVPSHEGLFVALVALEIDNEGLPLQNLQSATLTLKTTNANTKIGYAKDVPVAKYPTLNEKHGHLVSMKFRTQCGGGPVEKTINWLDDDKGTPNQPVFGNAADGNDGKPFNAKVYRFIGDTRVEEIPPNTLVNYTGRNPGIYERGEMKVTLQPGMAYALEFWSTRGGNGIQITPPGDSGDFYLPCPPTTGPDTAFNAQCTTAYVHDTGGPQGVGVSLPGDSSGNKYYTRTRVALSYNSSPATVIALNQGVGHAEAALDRQWDYDARGHNLAVTVIYEAIQISGSGGWIEYRARDVRTIPCPAPRPPVGYVDGAVCGPGGTLHGWALDEDYAGAIQVHIYVSEAEGAAKTFLGSTDANISAGGSQNRFSYDISKFTDGGDRYFYVYAIGVNTDGDPDGQNPQLIYSPKKMNGCRPYSYTPSTVADGDSQDPTTVKFSGTSGLSFSPYPSEAPSCVNGTAVTYQLTKTTASTGAQTVLTGNTNGDPYAGDCPPDQTKVYDTYTVPRGSFSAGDKYCMRVTFNPGSGYVDNAGNQVGPAGPASDSSSRESCLTVVNKPTFKVGNSAVQAGGSFRGSSASGTCTSSDGELAGWSNDSTTAPYNYGSSTGLSALALSKIVGFASAQVVATRTASSLSFANTDFNNIKAGAESPLYGGEFGEGYCLYDFDQLSATPLASNNTAVPTTSGDYTVPTGDLTLNGGSLADGARVTITVNGDVYISGDITYAGANLTWASRDSVPYFSIKATGNIYIDNNVTQLDGTYVAKSLKNNDGARVSGGIIYTCGVAYVVAPGNKYSSCNNQLTVNGSFVADKVNLMRTYGSLRDEKPRLVTGAPPVTAIPGSVELSRFSCGSNGASGYLGSHYYITYPSHPPTSLTPTNHDAPCPNNTKDKEGDAGYILPVSNGGWTPGSMALYTYSVTTAANDNYYFLHDDSSGPPGPGPSSRPGPAGWPVKIGYAFPTPGEGRIGVYSLYDQSNQPGEGHHFYSTNGGLPISEPGTEVYNLTNGTGVNVENNGNPAWYVYASAGQGGRAAVAAGLDSYAAPSPLTCSNVGSRPARSPSVCAAEVFIFSPEIYLWKNPSDEIQTGVNKGTTIFQSITSLPPVL
ncbi:MAG: exported protein of unknown function [Candidatus Saccharibacteria bacterium]|nr:exported protein of unknown function [Candidatus Saccharibacteria bacterium]